MDVCRRALVGRFPTLQPAAGSEFFIFYPRTCWVSFVLSCVVSDGRLGIMQTTDFREARSRVSHLRSGQKSVLSYRHLNHEFLGCKFRGDVIPTLVR